MTDDMAAPSELIEQAFIDPIRTVLLIDDRFPTMEDAIGGAPAERDAPEWERAARLWAGCRSRGWLCDVQHDPRWTDDAIHRIAGSDLIILDYHLEGGEETSAAACRRLLCKLAAYRHTNLVVLYTSRSHLDTVQREIIATLRGWRDWRRALDDVDLRDVFDDVRDALGTDATLAHEHILAHAAGSERWHRTLRKGIVGDAMRQVAEQAGDSASWPSDWQGRMLAALAEREFEDQSDTGEPTEAPRIVRSKDRWIECGNVFITLMTKPVETPADEMARLLAALRQGLTDWDPSALRAAVAFARAEVRRAGLQGDALSLPSPTLEAGWWYSILSAGDLEEQRRRARRLALDLVAGVGDVVGDFVGAFIARHVREPALDNAAAIKQACRLARVQSEPSAGFDLGHALNAFRSCERQPPDSMTCGSVFAVSDSEDESPSYFVCVTPACDLVPRAPSANYHWASTLYPWTPMLALRLSPLAKAQSKKKALGEASVGRHLFIEDADERLVLQLRPDPGTEQLTHELFLLAHERSGDDFAIRRIVLDAGEGRHPALREVSARLVAQLRPPYAEHVLNLAGQHLSRVGTDYFGVPSRDFKTKTGRTTERRADGAGERPAE